ncbi:hypothetical protein PR202_ga22063 [Eleusine coracana subsp. coracana]|uniref:Uncharacterized protein n=1 Tax=Eleusine coracana subsp. coracana TaxID=191504 RepID=A0AAV5D395_ELECO|nr:hypothetical protein PR202_ga22063 [Eleusine coracana subsp. coracana]
MPPGPWQLPLIGSLHHLVCTLPHHAMRDLSQRHGPLMLLRMGEHVAVVVSSADVAQDMFKGHETTFEQRPSTPGIDEVYSGNGALGVIFAPYGEHWRLLRRILVTELLSARRVEAFRHIRQDEAARLVSSIASSPPGQLVNVDELLAGFIADSSVRSIFGDRLPDRAAFLKMMKYGTDISSLFDLRDLFPSSWLVRLLPRSHKKEGHRLEVSRLIDDILQHHEERRAAGHGDSEQEQDMIDVLLSLQKEGSMNLSLTPGVINSLVMEIFGAALDTSTTTVQWAMAELIANPRVMEKAQQEIRRVLAGQERVREETLREMHYLKAVVKETLRLHPPGPFIPRVCLDDKKIQGYDLPRGTIVVINAWAISRDPKYWEDSQSFIPERFEGGRALDFRGLDYEFTPFGVGRRICPGITFSHANIEIALASLLYHFDWDLPFGVNNEEIDMTEAFGVTVKRKAELLLYPIPRNPLV